MRLPRPRLRTVAAVAILAVLVWRLGTGAFLDGLRAVDGTAVAAALAIGLVTTAASAWRWCLVARKLGLPLSLRTAVGDCYQALFLNTVLPAGVLGDVGRAVGHGRSAGNLGAGVRAVVLERSAGQVVLLVVGAAVLGTQPAVLAPLAGGLVPALVVGGPLLLAAAAWVRFGGGRAARVRAGLVRFGADARRGLLARDVWPGVAALSTVALAGYVALFVVAARAVGSPAPLAQLLPLVVLALLVMGLPISVGGWGPREAVTAVAFGAVGLGAAQGVGVAVVYGVLTLVGTLPGAAVLLLRRAGTRARAAAAAPDVPV
ncbi:MAG: flippase-like domain-containing protein, partial [Pseudonocardia sp.]|nr:flippase-like domain-containing protein [Pseudonocardia sp.]